MKIVNFTAENVKRLKAVEITPQGNIVHITGKNGQGKSSILDAIWWALAGKSAHQAQPIRDGEDEARVTLNLGNLIVKRSWKRKAEGNITTEIKVEAESGARFPSPQEMLDGLLGALSFDPLAFTRLKPMEQLEQIRGMVKLDIDIDALDAANKADFDKRTEKNREVKSLQAQAGAIALPEGVDIPDQQADIAALNAEVESAIQHNGDIELRKERRKGVAQKIERMKQINATAQETINGLREQISTLEGSIKVTTAEIAAEQQKLDQAEALPEPKEVEPIKAKITAALQMNSLVVKKQQKNNLALSAASAAADSKSLTESIEAREQQKAEAIAKAKMPIDGLGFSADGITYNGVPFEQASSAEQLRVSAAIAMASNPELRVLRIKDGSLLDEESLALLASMADASDFQIWIESVDSTGKIGIVISDGQVVAVNQDAEAKAEA